MRRYRLMIVALLGLAAVLLGVLFVGNINGNLVYYLTPAEALAQKSDFPDGRRFQLAGLVADGSVQSTSEGLRFDVVSGTTADAARVAVAYAGSPAQLFAPGIGVVLEGSWDGTTFDADTMKVKHDENYRPPAAGSTRPGGDGAP